jgi:hypothetical protein
MRASSRRPPPRRPLRVARALERVDGPLEVVTGPPRVGKRPSRVEEKLG